MQSSTTMYAKYNESDNVQFTESVFHIFIQLYNYFGICSLL